VYITIPEHLQKRFTGNFAFDPAIPLPVELPPGADRSNDLTAEMILSGILLDLTETPEGPHSGYYRRLITAVKPDIAAELQGAAVIKTKNGNYEAALEILRLLEALQGKNPVLLLNRALILEERAAALDNSTADAAVIAAAETESAYEKALAHSIPDTFFYAAFFYEKQGNYAKASVLLEAYLDTENENSGDDAHEESLDQEKYAGARELLKEIRNDGLDDKTFSEAIALIRNGNDEEGIQKAKEFLERRPGTGRGWFVLGWGLRRLSRWLDAAACFEKALELDCVNADVRNELAICRMETGNLKEAERELEKALRIDPDNVKIISNMGILAMKQGNGEKASAFFRVVLEKEPSDPVAKTFFN
jgi:tetratricopeptide (TPR) repeat protein